MKKVLVVDWLDKYGGAEKTIGSIANAIKFTKIYAMVNIMKNKEFVDMLSNQNISSYTTLLQKTKHRFRYFFFIFHYMMNTIKIDKDVNLIISSSHNVAKGVNKSNKKQLHISYFQARNFMYIWDEVDLYFGKLKYLLTPLLKILQKIDLKHASRPDFIIANSNFTRQWIKKVYKREATVIYPPVDINIFQLNSEKEDYYVFVGRIETIKRVDLIVNAFNQLEKKLIIIGDGKNAKDLLKIAKPNIEFKGFLPPDEVHKYLSKAKGYIHAGIEAFGIAPIEAQACGTPVIAFGEGGVLETVINETTGIFYQEQNVDHIVNAILKFENLRFDPLVIRKNAEKFSKERFEKEFKEYVNFKLKAFKQS